jgi:hypothetical protein
MAIYRFRAGEPNFNEGSRYMPWAFVFSDPFGRAEMLLIGEGIYFAAPETV